MGDIQQQPLPPLENSPEELEAQRIRERDHELRQYWLDPREDYPEPYYMLEYNGVPFSTVGGIQAITGQKKNGKTFVLTMLMAAVLGRGSRRVEEYLPGLTCPQRTVDYLGHEPSVLFVDTEMEKLSSAKVLRRVHWLCDWDMKEPQDRFHVLWLRQAIKDEREKTHEKRKRLTLNAIEALNPDFVIIDGLRDLMESINDEQEATSILTELGALADKRGICIWVALHLNPRPSNEQESKMRGHIGSELGNKGTDTLQSTKHKNNGDVYFTISQPDARNKDVDEITFRVTDDAGMLGVPKIFGNGGGASVSKKQEHDSVQDITRWIREAQERLTWPMSRKDIKQKVFGEIGGQKNDGMQQADLTVALNNGLLQESTLKVKGYYMLLPADDLPF